MFSREEAFVCLPSFFQEGGGRLHCRNRDPLVGRDTVCHRARREGVPRVGRSSPRERERGGEGGIRQCVHGSRVCFFVDLTEDVRLVCVFGTNSSCVRFYVCFCVWGELSVYDIP